MDLDPDTETLNIMKLNNVGLLKNSSVRLVDFERYTPNSLNNGRCYSGIERISEIQIMETVLRI